MSPRNELIRTIDEGAVLQLYIDNMPVYAYVVVSEPNIDRVADIVPADRFEADGDIHVIAISHPDDAQALIEDVSDNMNPEDTVVFLCSDHNTKNQVLTLFGINAGQLHHH